MELRLSKIYTWYTFLFFLKKKENKIYINQAKVSCNIQQTFSTRTGQNYIKWDVNYRWRQEDHWADFSITSNYQVLLVPTWIEYMSMIWFDLVDEIVYNSRQLSSQSLSDCSSFSIVFTRIYVTSTVPSGTFNKIETV